MPVPEYTAPAALAAADNSLTVDLPNGYSGEAFFTQRIEQDCDFRGREYTVCWSTLIGLQIDTLQGDFVRAPARWLTRAEFIRAYGEYMADILEERNSNQWSAE